jgi:4-amino-4-deoxy-L-arabinose transferase-like glycosyltransferase
LTGVQTRLGLAALTAIGFALRLVGIDQSLYGDEGYTFGIVDGHGLGDVISAVHDTSITPPLHYVLAWAAIQLGDPEITVRVPSLLLGTLTIPLVFVLGRRVAGVAAGWVAAAIVALSPFAIF